MKRSRGIFVVLALVAACTKPNSFSSTDVLEAGAIGDGPAADARVPDAAPDLVSSDQAPDVREMPDLVPDALADAPATPADAAPDLSPDLAPDLPAPPPVCTGCTDCQQCVNGQCAPRLVGVQNGACNGVCQACDGAGACKAEFRVSCYRDVDGDGWGDPTAPNMACAPTSACPTGFVADHTDCDDTSAEAHPQGDATHKVGFHDVPRANGSWDWDCNSINEKENPVTYTSCAFDCSELPKGGAPAPDCGVTYTSMSCAKPPPRFICMGFQAMYTQRCR